mmetsp:Transcript_30415/g.87173  ORF Transcript_30415/g.87173 Transcript_30415/m.87173 type:complete len:378 (+) Transcript_30415:91-1224(+)
MRPFLFPHPGASLCVAIFAACRLAVLCSGKASDCPADVKGVEGQFLLQHGRHLDVVQPSTLSDSLYIIIPTAIKTKDVTMRMQKSMERRLRPQDRYFHICDVGCAAATNGSLHNVVEMDGSVFPGGRCTVNGTDCFGHMEAQMKFVFGLIHQVRELKKAGSEMPAWWLVKDDDTYVHVANLMQSIQGYRPTDLVSFADTTCTGICGGAGWLLSNSLAERLALDHGDRWMHLMHKNRPKAWWTLLYCFDMHIPEIIQWVPGARLFWHPGMMFASPFDDRCTGDSYRGLSWAPSQREILSRETGKGCNCHGPEWRAVVSPLPELSEDIGACHASSACRCSFSRSPCTWHLQASKSMKHFHAAVELLDEDLGPASPARRA